MHGQTNIKFLVYIHSNLAAATLNTLLRQYKEDLVPISIHDLKLFITVF